MGKVANLETVQHDFEAEDTQRAAEVTESVKALAVPFQVRRYRKVALHVLAVQI